MVIELDEKELQVIANALANAYGKSSAPAKKQIVDLLARLLIHSDIRSGLRKNV